MLWYYGQALAEEVRSSLSKMWSCAMQAPGEAASVRSGSRDFSPVGGMEAGGDSNAHLLCWCSLEHSHSGPHLPIRRHFLTPCCIPKPVLGTKSQIHGEEVSQEALSQEEAQSML